ncbi:hypothetical protein [Rikenella microfusus]|uniref:hypothetical protein n=1 Tax=Rikenella microfusus TaxID=28139 RepID=UPI001DA813AD|nr:hypothetical protein [Rikenella microfusus]HJE87771.1 hypothetical protein [Rikenella microfusus]
MKDNDFSDTTLGRFPFFALFLHDGSFICKGTKYFSPQVHSESPKRPPARRKGSSFKRGSGAAAPQKRNSVFSAYAENTEFPCGRPDTVTALVGVAEATADKSLTVVSLSFLR